MDFGYDSKSQKFSDLAPIIRRAEEYRSNVKIGNVKIAFNVAEIEKLFNKS